MTFANRPGSEVDIIERFERNARARPEATAIVYGAERVSYGELDARGNRLAHLLRARGVGPESVVGLCLTRRPEAFAGMLGILKAGGAFLPMDPAHPPQRRAAMLEAGGARLLLSEHALKDPLPGCDVPTLLDEDLAAELGSYPGSPPERRLHPQNLRCVIFTSGSTGRPKGIGLCSRSIENVVRWALNRFPGPQVFLQFTSLAFDMSLEEIFGALLGGGSLVVAEEKHRQDPAELLELVAREGVERAYLSPAFLRQLAWAATRNPRRTGPFRLKQIVAAGESLRLTPEVRRFLRDLGGAVLENQYGPSETHQATACTLTGDPTRWPDTPPLGHPIPGVQVHLLDDSLAPVREGDPGEVCIAGTGVARGYVGRPDLTAERFLPDPFGAPGSRMYRTGDLARRAPTGELEFLGRVDGQVKVRGHRVEPSEVDAVFAGHPDVLDSATIGHQAGDGTWSLTAYLVPAPGKTLPDTSALRGFVNERLPGYMVPSSLVAIPALPLDRNGKVDRAALPPPGAAGRRSATPYAAPGNPQQELILGIWAEALETHRIGIDDDFLELGGNSLQAMQIIARVREEFDVDLPVRGLFESPTVRELARAVEEAIIAELSELGSGEASSG